MAIEFHGVDSRSPLGKIMALVIEPIPGSPEEPVGEEGERWRRSVDERTAAAVASFLNETLNVEALTILTNHLHGSIA